MHFTRASSFNSTMFAPPARLLSKSINSYLSLDPEASEKLAAFDGKVIAIELQGVNKTVYLLPKEESGETFVDATDNFDGEVDTTLRGSPLALFKMGMASDVAAMMLKGEVEIEGNVRLGKDFKKLIAELDVDWEERLSSLIGDTAASKAASLVRRFSSWGSRSKDSLIANISEYLQEESRDVVSGAELEMFYNNIDLLRDDVDRVVARYEALKEK